MTPASVARPTVPRRTEVNYEPDHLDHCRHSRARDDPRARAAPSEGRAATDWLRRRRSEHLRHAERDAARTRDVEGTGAAVVRTDRVLQGPAQPDDQSLS